MRTSIIIDCSLFRDNVAKVKQLLRPETKFLAVIKADGYGHGAISLANEAIKVGVDYFGVATIEEAIVLREAGISIPILILTEPPDIESLHIALYYDITLTITSNAFLKELDDLTQKFEKQIKVHLKVNTGMNRIGVDPSQVLGLLQEMSGMDGIFCEGLFTHFADADSDASEYTQMQLDTFQALLDSVASAGLSVPLAHCANSSATRNFPKSHFDMVRVGIDLYSNIMSFKAKIVELRTLEKGSPVGYGLSYRSKAKSRLAVLSVGYADGYNRLLSNQGWVLIKGIKCPIRGRVCMDMTMVEVPMGMSLSVGDNATLVGDCSGVSVSVSDIANQIETIDYEVMCNIGRRARRVYLP
jgi:alanine racemase